MKFYRAGAIAGLAILASAAAASAQTVVISPDQQTVIHKYVIEHKVAPVEVPSDVTVSVGTALPDTIDLQQIDVPDVSTEYQYVVVNGQTLVVDPQTRKIVQIIN